LEIPFRLGIPCGWNFWGSLAGNLTSDAAVGSNADGRLKVFVHGTHYTLWHNSQLAPGRPGWSGWTSLGGAPEKRAVNESELIETGVALGQQSIGHYE
jgi:hypothetical protein